jgi:hypothetical protein
VGWGVVPPFNAARLSKLKAAYHEIFKKYSV